MRPWILGLCGIVTCVSFPAAYAQDADVAEGKKLYEKECMVCHGRNDADSAAQGRFLPQRLAHAHTVVGNSTVIDAGGNLWMAGADTQLAVAPPYGPNLRGIIGRPAGTVPGFNYSAPFLKNLMGMIWDEGSLDIWMTSTQRWVPGVTMYYTQKNGDIRRKIILYLKANS